MVAEYYAAGQTIAAKGSVVDQKIKAALDVLQEASAAALAAAAPTHESSEPQIALGMDKPALADQIKPPHTSESTNIQSAALALQPASQPGKKQLHLSYASWLMTGTAFALAIVAIVIGRSRLRRGQVLRATPVARDLEVVELDYSHRLQTELAPQLVQIVRQAFVQELAGQRRDLLVAQQTAAAEVIRLVHRMDALQVVMQERLQTYETQIRNLESELTARTEENRQLIRLKIQMIRHQVESESGAKRIEFN